MKVELRDLTPDERKSLQVRFEGLASRRFAPAPKKPRQEVWWPKAPLDGRAFPEGLTPADGDDEFNESARLLGFLNGACGSEFYIANLSAPKPYFRHAGKLDAALIEWVRKRLVSNPTCILASTVDLFIIIDSRMHYSVIGGTAELIDKLERRFGGPGALQESFGQFVDRMRLGSGIDDVRWAKDYLQKWSGWPADR